VPEAAQTLGLSRAKVYELVASGELGSIKIDGSRRIPTQDLHQFVERLRVGDGTSAEVSLTLAGGQGAA
jgi:excisionase family DNA binding protein